MKESEIRKKAIEILKKDKWIVWYPAKSKWKKEQDIFGVFDLICIRMWKKMIEMKFVQLTTLSNIRAREKKVKKFTDIISLPAEVWGWNKIKKEFKIIKM
jgi:hypothetical protein